MHYAPATMTKKRNLVAAEIDAVIVDGVLDPAAQLRSIRLDALAQFAPLLAGAAVLSCFVLASILFGRIETMHLVAWSLLVIASNWLMVRRLEINALLHVRRDPPRQTLVEAALLIGLVAGLWAAIPVTVYRSQPDDIQTVLTCAIGAMMCGALAIAAVPAAAMIWAACSPSGSASRCISAAIASRCRCRCS